MNKPQDAPQNAKPLYRELVTIAGNTSCSPITSRR